MVNDGHDASEWLRIGGSNAGWDGPPGESPTASSLPQNPVAQGKGGAPAGGIGFRLDGFGDLRISNLVVKYISNDGFSNQTCLII